MSEYMWSPRGGERRCGGRRANEPRPARFAAADVQQPRAGRELEQRVQVLPVSALEDARALQQPRAVLRADDLRVLERAVLPHLAGRRRGRRGVGRGRRGAVVQVLKLGPSRCISGDVGGGVSRAWKMGRYGSRRKPGLRAPQTTRSK